MNVLIDVGELTHTLDIVAPCFRYLSEHDMPIYVMSYSSRYHIFSDFITGFVEVPERYREYRPNGFGLENINGKGIKKLEGICRKTLKCQKPVFYKPWMIWSDIKHSLSFNKTYIKYNSNPLYMRFIEDLVGLDTKFITIVPRTEDDYFFWGELINLLLLTNKFRNFKIVAVGLEEDMHSFGSLGGVYDLTEVCVADYSAFVSSVFSKTILTIGGHSCTTTLSQHCGVPTYMGVESNASPSIVFHQVIDFFEKQ